MWLGGGDVVITGLGALRRHWKLASTSSEQE